MQGPLRIGSLFSGVGGLDLGLERAGLGRVQWQCESDPFCQAVLRKHWTSALLMDDVRGLDNDDGGLDADVLCGGFPCQDISQANHQATGLAGARSGFWREFDRVIGAIHPSIVVVENVAGAWRRWVPDVRRDIERRNYWSVPLFVRANHCGLPHRRTRCFVVGLASHADAARLADAVGGAVPSEKGYAWTCPDDTRAAWAGTRGDGLARAVVVRDAHGLPGRVDRRRDAARVAALGNAVVPACAEVVGRLILSSLGGAM